MKIAQRISELFYSATESEKRQGLFWYSDSRDYLKAMAVHYKVELKVMIGVVAALSPLQNWKSNLRMANSLMKGRRVTGLFKNIQKAKAIKKTSRVLPHLHGPKVRPFFFNLMGNESEVTIDTLMIYAYHGNTKSNRLSKKQRRDLEAQVHMLSRSHGLTPAQAQATVWIAYHRVYKSNFPGCVSLLKIF